MATVSPPASSRRPSAPALFTAPLPPPPPPATPHPPALAARGADSLGFKWRPAPVVPGAGAPAYVLAMAPAEAAVGAAATGEDDGDRDGDGPWVEAYRGPDPATVVGGLTPGSLYAARVKVSEKEGRGERKEGAQNGVGRACLPAASPPFRFAWCAW